MTNLTIIANVTAKADKINLVKSELEKLIDVTRAEEGCVKYDLYRDNETSAHFMFYESWETRDLWQKHMGNQHLKDFIAATDGAIAEFIVNEMTEIS